MIEINMTGIKEIKDALDQLPKKMSRGVYLDALRKSARPVRDAARANVPVDSGALKQSIAVRAVPKKFSANPAVRVVAGGAKKTGKKRFDAFYAHIVEEGSKGHFIGPRKGIRKALKFGNDLFSKGHRVRGVRAQKFMKRAFQAKGADAVKIFQTELGKALERAVNRLFKR